MELLINGQQKIVPGATVIADIVDFFGLNQKMIVIEHNREILARDAYADTPVAAGDTIEIVHFVGGG